MTSAGSADIEEGSSATVYTATAEDAEGHSFTFSVSGDDAALFDIDASSGALTFKTAPNYENALDADANNQYQLTIVATDSQSAAGEKAITVNVLNDLRYRVISPTPKSNLEGASNASIPVVLEFYENDGGSNSLSGLSVTAGGTTLSQSSDNDKIWQGLATASNGTFNIDIAASGANAKSMNSSVTLKNLLSLAGSWSLALDTDLSRLIIPYNTTGKFYSYSIADNTMQELSSFRDSFSISIYDIGYHSGNKSFYLGASALYQVNNDLSSVSQISFDNAITPVLSSWGLGIDPVNDRVYSSSLTSSKGLYQYNVGADSWAFLDVQFSGDIANTDNYLAVDSVNNSVYRTARKDFAIHSINLADNSSSILHSLPSLDVEKDLGKIKYSGDGKLFVAGRYTDSVLEVTTSDGSARTLSGFDIYDSGYSAGVGPVIGSGDSFEDVTALAYDASNSLLYALGAKYLYEVNVSNGNRSIVYDSSAGTGPRSLSGAGMDVNLSSREAVALGTRKGEYLLVNLLSGEKEKYNYSTSFEKTKRSVIAAASIDSKNMRAVIKHVVFNTDSISQIIDQVDLMSGAATKLYDETHSLSYLDYSIDSTGENVVLLSGESTVATQTVTVRSLVSTTENNYSLSFVPAGNETRRLIRISTGNNGKIYAVDAEPVSEGSSTMGNLRLIELDPIGQSYTVLSSIDTTGLSNPQNVLNIVTDRDNNALYILGFDNSVKIYDLSASEMSEITFSQNIDGDRFVSMKRDTASGVYWLLSSTGRVVLYSQGKNITLVN